METKLIQLAILRSLAVAESAKPVLCGPTHTEVKRERHQFEFDTADAWIIERAGNISLCHYKACADKARVDGAIVTPYFKKG